MRDMFYGRVQLCFHLNDPVERDAYKRICSEPSRGKTKFVADCIATLKDKNDVAEQIAELVVKKLLKEGMAIPNINLSSQTKKTTGRKRGRPRKHPIEIVDSEHPVATEIVALTATDKNNISIDDTVPVGNEQLNDTQDQMRESEIAFLDDDMLRSMESFVNG